MQEQHVGVIRPGQRFDFNAYRPFRECYEKELRKPEVNHVVVDLNDVKYIDSAALGILLMLREKAQEAGKTVELRGPRDVVRDVLEVANFFRLFKVS